MVYLSLLKTFSSPMLEYSNRHKMLNVFKIGAYCNTCTLSFLSLKLENILNKHFQNVTKIKYRLVKLVLVFVIFKRCDYMVPSLILFSKFVFFVLYLSFLFFFFHSLFNVDRYIQFFNNIDRLIILTKIDGMVDIKNNITECL